MTPQEKAKELYDRYYQINNIDEADHIRKACARLSAGLAVDEIIKELTEEISPSVHGFRHQYWQQVKKHIQEL